MCYEKNIFIDFNCSLDFLFIVLFLQCGTVLCDVLYIDALPFRNLAAGGFLMDLNIYSHIIDVNDSFRWGTKNILEICAANGHLYGVTPASWVDKMAPYYCFL